MLNLQGVFENFQLLRDAADILILTVIFYYMFKLLNNNGASKVIYAIVIVLTVSVVACVFGLKAMSAIAPYLFLLIAVFTTVIYANEIKRLIWRYNNPTMFDKMKSDQSYDEKELRSAIDDIMKAVLSLAKKDVGALIVLVKRSDNKMPVSLLETGTLVNGFVSVQLLENIFMPKSPLHDGAVVIMGNRVLGAGCFLPLTQDNNLPKDLGTRHRAGIGVTETNDYVAIVVSEETGIITICENGKYRRYADAAMLKSALEEAYGLTVRPKHTIRWMKK